MAPMTLIKRPNEVRIYQMDFSQFPEIIAGDTLTGTPSVVATVVGGALVSLPSLASPGLSTDKKSALVTISGGAPNNSYYIAFTCGTTLGSTLEGVGQLTVTNV